VTVNIGLITSEALVLGCDSVASTIDYLLDPTGHYATDADGKPIRDADGKFIIKFGYEDFRPIVTNAWGGVTKMFQIHPDPSPVVAVTSGLAKLQERSIASHAIEFFAKAKRRDQKLVNIKIICEQFLKAMRGRYNAHYRGSPLPEQFREGPEFLIGGIGRDDEFPSLYRVSVQHNLIVEDFVGGKTGVSWNGQADAVERFIRGFDGPIRQYVESTIGEALKTHATATQAYITELVNGILDKLHQALPPGTEIKPPELGKIALDWMRFSLQIDYANLPLQEAVSFVSAMVMSQASKARFAVGVATVGGRTHIGVVTKADGFKSLNEPELTHRYTGFSDDV